MGLNAAGQVCWCTGFSQNSYPPPQGGTPAFVKTTSLIVHAVANADRFCRCRNQSVLSPENLIRVPWHCIRPAHDHGDTDRKHVDGIHGSMDAVQ